MDAREKLLDEIADAYGEIDDVVEEYEDEVKARFALLLNEQGERVPSIWEQGECPIDTTLDALVKVPVAQRGEKWELLTRRLIACAREQTWVEVLSIPFLKAAEKHTKRVQAARSQITDDDLRSIAKTGPGKQRFKTMRDNRRAKRVGSDVRI